MNETRRNSLNDENGFESYRISNFFIFNYLSEFWFKKIWEFSNLIIAIIEFKFNEGENGTRLKDFWIK